MAIPEILDQINSARLADLPFNLIGDELATVRAYLALHPRADKDQGAPANEADVRRFFADLPHTTGVGLIRVPADVVAELAEALS